MEHTRAGQTRPGTGVKGGFSGTRAEADRGQCGLVEVGPSGSPLFVSVQKGLLLRGPWEGSGDREGERCNWIWPHHLPLTRYQLRWAMAPGVSCQGGRGIFTACQAPWRPGTMFPGDNDRGPCLPSPTSVPTAQALAPRSREAGAPQGPQPHGPQPRGPQPAMSWQRAQVARR